jgi:hypothetical protein
MLELSPTINFPLTKQNRKKEELIQSVIELINDDERLLKNDDRKT